MSTDEPSLAATANCRLAGARGSTLADDAGLADLTGLTACTIEDRLLKHKTCKVRAGARTVTERVQLAKTGRTVTVGVAECSLLELWLVILSPSIKL